MKPIILLFTLIIFVFAPSSQQAQTSAETNCKNRAPARSEIEEMFGQAVNCNNHSGKCIDKAGKEIKCPEVPKEITCFRTERGTTIKAEFKDSGFAGKITVFDSSIFYRAAGVGEQIIMISGRGRLLKKDNELLAKMTSCDFAYTEEYEFLTMYFWGKGCQGSSPGGVTITWEK